MTLTQKEYSQRHYRKRKDNGLCPRCGKELDREGHYCSECLVKNREYRRENRIFYREHGLCTCCGKEKVFGDEKQCIECREKNYKKRKPLTEKQREERNKIVRTNHKKTYKERLEKGICTRCGKRKADAGRKKCRICLDKDAFMHRKANFDKVNTIEYRDKNNLCYYCGEPVDTEKKICSKCMEKCVENGKKSLSVNSYWKMDNNIVFKKGRSYAGNVERSKYGEINRENNQ